MYEIRFSVTIQGLRYNFTYRAATREQVHAYGFDAETRLGRISDVYVRQV